MSNRGLIEMSKKGLIPALKKDENYLCEPCIYGKQHRIRFVCSSKHSAAVLELVHSDIWGPAPVLARDGAKYFLTFIDNFSRKVWVYLIREKSNVFAWFKACRAKIEKEIEKLVKYLQIDNRGEFTNHEFRSYYEENVEKSDRQYV